MPIIGVPNPADSNDADRQDFIDQMSSPIAHVLTNPGDLWTDFEVLSQPTMVFVAADGQATLKVDSPGPQILLERVNALAADS